MGVGPLAGCGVVGGQSSALDFPWLVGHDRGIDRIVGAISEKSVFTSIRIVANGMIMRGNILRGRGCLSSTRRSITPSDSRGPIHMTQNTRREHSQVSAAEPAPGSAQS